ncbi:MAG TPA: O-antigen ligase family protein [Nitrospiria bacterium]|nr:O-antigen ligase family protein [Nitrospiria bacterium]
MTDRFVWRRFSIPSRVWAGVLSRPSAAGVLSALLCGFIVLMPLLAGGNELYGLSPSTAMLAAQLLVLVLSVVWWVARLDDWRWTPVPPGVAVSGGVWIGWTTLSTIASDLPYESQVSVITVAVCIVLAYAAADLLRTERDLRRAAQAVLAGAALVGFYGIVQGVVGLPNWLIQAQANRASQDLIELASQGRVFSTFLNVNAFAAYLAMTVPIGAYLVLTDSRLIGQLFSGGALLLVVMALAMTGSRGGWLVALFATIGAAWFSANRHDWRRIGVRLGLILLTGLLVVGFLWATQPLAIENPLERFFSVTMGLKTSAQNRWSYWQGAVRLIIQHPWLGTGPGTFASSYQSVQTDGAYARYAHNLYLQLAAETGVAGAASFLAFAGSLIWAAFRLNSVFARVTALAACALLLHGLIDFSWEVAADQWLWGLLAGMIVACWRLERRGDGSPVALGASVKTAGTLAAVPVAVLLLMAVGRPYLAEGYLQSAIAWSIADDADRAADLGREAVARAPGSARARNFLATAYRRQWEKSGHTTWLDRALEQHDRAVALTPTVGLYHDERGTTLWAMGRHADAVAEWKAAHTRYPMSPLFALHYGQGLSATGHDQEAARVLEAAAATQSAFLSAGSPDLRPLYDVHFSLAKLYERLGEPDRAVEEYQEVIDLVHRSPERIALNPLLAGRIAIEPKLWFEPKSYLELGDLYRRQGEKAKALASYQQAVALDPHYEKANQRVAAMTGPVPRAP